VLELGGKAAAIVCADADLERTANALVWGAFANSGQVCVSVERVYAHASVHDELLARIVEKTTKLRQGRGEGEVDVGAVTWSRQLENVEDLVTKATQQGARIAAGGRRRPGPGQFYEPTVLVDCRQDMDIMRREIFGPVMPIMKVASEEQALALANDSHLGLMGYVFTKDRKKGRRLAERVDAGTVMVNDVLATFAAPETPWGGTKQSGVGRTHSDQGLRELSELRHVNYDRVALRRDPWWYPYSSKVFQGSLKILRLLYRPGKR
jgi:succinate-semialdehyde dehydrogenase/glutarate-semialdehyde dehydrogenase